MSRPGDDYLVKARAAWGNELPDWIEELAKEANRITARSLAKRLGYSNAVISFVLGRKYKGDMKRVEEIVRGALLGSTVICPIVGEIGRDQCLEHQKLGNTGASAIRAAIARECSSGRCQHSRLKPKE
ncbi:transcriptional regulator [Rhodopseudomonas sp.]|uniref:transcriptional regulator n=1 Tax=Rhodopseudomonas sp. TaxID=1078 RepID=UPI003B3A49B9